MSALAALAARALATVGRHVGGPLGALPLAAFASATGLLLIAIADTLGRLALPGATLLWWVGLLAIVVPIGLRSLGREASRTERVGLVVLLGMALYLVKVLHSPAAFTMFDEFHHWATLDDIVVTGRLFTPNNILLASPYYPGLEIIGDLLVRSGFSVWEAGVVVIGGARLLMMLALFLLYERASGDARLAGVGAMVYAANPSFLFFDSQYAYESLALPLAVFVMWCVLRREGGRETGETGMTSPGGVTRVPGGVLAVGLTLCLLLGIAATVVTHHITSIALCGFLLVWAVVAAVRRHGQSASGGVTGPALLAVTATVAWMLYVASVTVGYLAPAISGALDQVLALIAGEEGSRVLFQTATGAAAPSWEQLVGYGSVGIMIASLPLGLLWVWRHYRHGALPLTLAVAAALYPATLLGRLTVRGAELAARSTEFLFLGAAFVAALTATVLYDLVSRPGDPGQQRWRQALVGAWMPVRRPVLVGALVVLFMGAAVLGIPFWARLPGPYLVSADTRSVEPQGIAAARWTLAEIGPGNRFLSDRTNRTLLATYGRQHPISAVGDQIQRQGALLRHDPLGGRPPAPPARGDGLCDRRSASAQLAALRGCVRGARRGAQGRRVDRTDAGRRAREMGRSRRRGPDLRQR